MLTESQKLEVLVTLGIELNQIKDLDILMERILREARRFVNADAGSIYIREGEHLTFSYSQNEDLQKRLPPGGKLIYSRFTIPMDRNSIAGYSAVTGRAVNVPDVYKLGSKVPYHFSEKFDIASGYKTRSVLAMPLKNIRDDIIGVLQIINAQNDAGKIVHFTEHDERMMSHFASTASVALERAQLMRSIILRTIKMAELRDPNETGAHANRVASYAVEIYEQWARRRGLSEKEIDARRDTLRMAAMLHDVGKVAIPDSILKKKSRLTEKEYRLMKRHTSYGALLFAEKRSELDEAAEIVALNHHEWWNGNGYPGIIGADGKHRGKMKEEIPLLGRFVALADVFDALTSCRSYKEAWNEERAYEMIRSQSGKQFDPELVEIFFTCVDSLRQIRLRYPEESSPSEQGLFLKIHTVN